MERVVVKKNWVNSLTDSLSEWFWTWCVGAPIVGGVLVTGLGAVHGYMVTPQDENVAPYMVSSIKNAHVNTWKAVYFLVDTTVQTVNAIRPSTESSAPAPAESPNVPKPPLPGPSEELGEIPKPINDIVPDVGECDPYGPRDFSYNPPRLVCEIHG